MSCNSPLYRLVIPQGGETLVSPRLLKRMRGNGVIINRVEYDYFRNVKGVSPDAFQTIPCGKCLGCKVDYQSLWSTRVQLECSLYKDNYFITLTYNDEHIKKSLVIDPVTGKTDFKGIVSKTDFTAFIKRLRARLDYKGKDSCRFLACFEYGENGLRPHIHFIGCNLQLDDLKYFYSKSKKGSLRPDYQTGDEIYFRSKLIEDCWGKGFCLVTRVTPANCAYVASYVNKSVSPSEIKSNLSGENFYKITRDFYRPCVVETLFSCGLMPSPCLHFSRRNGLGFSYFTKEERGYYVKFGRLKPRKGVKLFKKHFRYFDDLLAKKHELLKIVVQDVRKRSADVKTLLQWSSSDLFELSRKEEILALKLKQTKKKRDL